MTPRRRTWLLRAGIVVLVLVAMFAGGLFYLGRRFEPYIRQQAIEYLRDRFESEVELTRLQVSVPTNAAWKLMTHGGIALATVHGEGLVMRHRGRTDVPPMFVLRDFTATVDLQTVFTAAKTVPLVTLRGMEIHIPPKGERPDLGGGGDRTDDKKEDAKEGKDGGESNGVLIEAVEIEDAELEILPRDRQKVPLHFDLHSIHLKSVGNKAEMQYDAYLSNPKPAGEIHSVGSFGPWAAGEPSDTPLAGDYTFRDADLGVFKAIAGILQSSGTFEGQLGSIQAKGEAVVPDFRLKMSGNPVPLKTTFEVEVDGTNGNTTLQPVHAELGTSRFVTSGAVIKHDGDTHRTIDLEAHIPAANLTDLLRLAMKGEPFMSGIVAVDTRILIPPLDGSVKEKLELDGKFDVKSGMFLRSKIQDQIDGLSRKAQGRPKAEEIDQVVSRMSGDFRLDDQVLTFQSLAFAVAGAAIHLDGTYDMDADALDMRGALALDAKISQTQSGWKRWVLKPVDPFFSKNGAGTYMKIKIGGSSKAPKFGLDR